MLMAAGRAGRRSGWGRSGEKMRIGPSVVNVGARKRDTNRWMCGAHEGVVVRTRQLDLSHCKGVAEVPRGGCEPLSTDGHEAASNSFLSQTQVCWSQCCIAPPSALHILCVGWCRPNLRLRDFYMISGSFRFASLLSAACLAGLSTLAPVQAGGLFGSGPVDLQVGGIVFVTPEYEGSDDYRVMGAPFIAPAGGLGDGDKGFVSFRGPSDVRFRVFRAGPFEAGPVAGYRFDRDQDDGDLLRGLGDIDGGLILGGYVAYGYDMLRGFASYQHQVTGDDDTGGVLDFGLESLHHLSPRVSIRGTFGAVYASNDYNETYFGITNAQAATSVSGLNAYEADGGIKNVYLGLSSDVALDERWTLKLTGKYSRLVGDAADSPIVEAEDQFMGGLGVTYKFTFDR